MCPLNIDRDFWAGPLVARTGIGGRDRVAVLVEEIQAGGVGNAEILSKTARALVL